MKLILEEQEALFQVASSLKKSAEIANEEAPRDLSLSDSLSLSLTLSLSVSLSLSLRYRYSIFSTPDPIDCRRMRG